MRGSQTWSTFARVARLSDLEQPLLVVAEHPDGARFSEDLQDSRAVGAACDEITHEHQAVGLAEGERIQKFRKLCRTAMHVSYEYCATHTTQVTHLAERVKTLVTSTNGVLGDEPLGDR